MHIILLRLLIRLLRRVSIYDIPTTLVACLCLLFYIIIIILQPLHCVVQLIVLSVFVDFPSKTAAFLFRITIPIRTTETERFIPYTAVTRINGRRTINGYNITTAQ